MGVFGIGGRGKDDGEKGKLAQVRARAAKLLGITFRAMRYRMERLGIK